MVIYINVFTDFVSECFIYICIYIYIYIYINLFIPCQQSMAHMVLPVVGGSGGGN